MQAFLEYVVKGLVENPDEVSVTPVDQGDSFATGAAAIEISAARPFASAAENVAYDGALAAAESWVSSATLTTNQRAPLVAHRGQRQEGPALLGRDRGRPPA